MIARLTQIGLAHPRRVLIIAAILFAFAAVSSNGVANRLDPHGADDPETESIKANQQLYQAGYREPGILVVVRGEVDDPRTRERVEGITQGLKDRDDVASVTGYYETGSKKFVSRSGQATYLAVGARPTSDRGMKEVAEEIERELAPQAPGVLVGGPAVALAQANEQVDSDLRKAEIIAFPLLFLLSLVVFRSLVAALLPVLIGALAIVGAMFALRAMSEVASISVLSLNTATALGLGLSIDYALFIVSRYREELARQGPGAGALEVTMSTSGRAVLYSSLMVAAALASLWVFPQRTIYSLGIGGGVVALLAGMVSLTVLPAVLAILGKRVNALAPAALQRRAEREARPEEEGFWFRLSRFVSRRPLPIATTGALLLIVLSLPILGLKFTLFDSSQLPAGRSAHEVNRVIERQFPPQDNDPIQVVVEGDVSSVTEVEQNLRTLPGITHLRTQRFGGISLIEAGSDSPSYDAEATDRVERIREIERPPGTNLRVTGQTAEFVDFQASSVDHGLVAAAIVALATLLLIFLMTGSVVLPIKALLMNILTLSAAFGLLVWIFQNGRLESLLGYESQGAIDQSIPILILALAFGLSTDYTVFLLARIKEARDSGHSDSAAVAVGLERSGRIVTAAAILFSVAFGAFATSALLFVKQNALGVAFAILIDATLVRALLVPSLMELLGRRNWWAPPPLRRLHQRFGLNEMPNPPWRPPPASPSGTTPAPSGSSEAAREGIRDG